MAEDLLALTFIQPWGTAALELGKDVENRPWAPWPRVIGKRIAVHAGAKLDKRDQWGLKRELDVDIIDPPLSALLGSIQVMGYVDVAAHRVGHPNHPWFEGVTARRAEQALKSRWRAADAKFLWILGAAYTLPEPIPCKGSLSLWRVPAEHVPALLAGTTPLVTFGGVHV